MLIRNWIPQHYKPAPADNLVEVLDSAGKPVCLMPYESVVAQGLVYRSVSTLVCDHAGNILFRELPDHKFDVAFHAPLQAGSSLEEGVERQLNALPGIAAAPFLAGRLEPCEATHGSQATVFVVKVSPALLKAIECAPFFRAEAGEAAFFAQNDYLAPLAAKCLPLLNP